MGRPGPAVAVEPVDSLPLLLTRLACLWPAEESALPAEPGARIPGEIDETN